MQQQLVTWTDARRGREVPARVYLPESAPERCPLIVFSHGLGGSRDGYRYLGEHWSSQGYVCIHPSHAGSDAVAFRHLKGKPYTRLMALLDDPGNAANRPLDISFVLDQAAADADLRERVDFERVGVGGHSFGAFTAQALAGMRIELGGLPRSDFRDERVKAIVAMSPQSAGRLGIHTRSWDTIATPAMYVTGTQDNEPQVGSAGRRMAFDAAPGPDQYLLTIENATHMAFSDHELRLPGAARRRDPNHFYYVQQATTRFWNAHLRGDRASQRWLAEGALEALSRGECRLEFKKLRAV